MQRAILCAACALAGPGAALGAPARPWDARDVAAAEGFRSAERERADRYRARIQTPVASERGRTASGREPAKAPKSPVAGRETPRSGGFVSKFFAGIVGAVVDEFDREAIESAARRVRTSLRWWQTEGSPRANRLLEWIADVAGTVGE
ncbi:MAG: hypothetical protein OEP95_16285 [Myxococcales bacterium]|nr:hypothetical protein [Myxococcales bacterium]